MTPTLVPMSVGEQRPEAPDRNRERPVPTRKDWDETVANIAKPAPSGKKTPWRVRVGTIMHYTPEPGTRVVERIEYDDHVEYVLEIVPKDEAGEA